METDQLESGIFLKFGEAETEEMETNQVSVFNEFSFAWENVMQLLFPQPTEEMMETDQETVADSPYVAQLEKIMEAMKESIQMPIPFGLAGDSNLAGGSYRYENIRSKIYDTRTGRNDRNPGAE